MRFAVLVLLAGCLRSHTVQCDDQRVCPSGTVCAIVTEFSGDLRPYCASHEEIEACESGTCADGHACYDGVCLPSGCGNKLRDQGEMCDEGDTRDRDGCSANCESTEACGNGYIDFTVREECDDSNTLSHDGCSATCNADSPVWTALESPVGRDGTVVAYDTDRDVVVMFGGERPDGALLADTWELDRHAWVPRRTATAPSGRRSAAMVYDANRKRMVFWGSRAGNLDVWEYDGATWTIAPSSTPTAPALRDKPSMVYDPRGKRVLMYGGYGTDTYYDTWSWTAAGWTRIDTGVGLPTVDNPVLAFDPERGAIVLVGTNGAAMSETWELGANDVWILKATGGVPASFYRSLAWNPVAHQLLLFLSATNWWLWNGTAWTAMPNAPTQGTDVQLAATITRGSMVAIERNVAVMQTRVLAPGGVFSRLDDGAPQAREDAAAAVDVAGRRVLFVGGLGQSDPPQIWDGAWHALPTTDAPGATNGYSIAYDEARSHFVVFGGGQADTHVWNGTAWSVLVGNGPEPRAFAAMAFDRARQHTVLFGGANGSPIYGDTWIWNGTAWTKATPSVSPPARLAAGMAYDPIAQRVVLFGGRDASGSDLDDTWEWDGSNWTRLAPKTSPARRTPQLAWDAARGRVVTFGSRFTGLSDAWELSREPELSWVQVPVLAPLDGRTSNTLVSSFDGAGVLSIGGEIAGGDTTVMRLRWDNVTAETCDGPDRDGDGLAACADRDCWAICTPLCDPRLDACLGEGPRCGDAICDLRRESCVTCPSDCACTAKCGDYVCTAGETCAGDCP